MINFRYHIVTLVAVFLALGLGILFGASFVDQSVVDALRTAQNRIEERSAELRKDVLALERENKSLDEFIESGEPFLISQALRDRPIVLLSFESTDEDLVTQVGASLVRSGARIEAAIQLSDNLDLASEERKRQVAVAVDRRPEDDLTEISQSLVQQMHDSLSSRSPGFLQRLLDLQLASVSNIVGAAPRPLPEVAIEGTAIVILGGDADNNALTERFLLPMVRALSGSGVICTVAEPGRRTPNVEAVREANLNAVTVDGVDASAGRAALVLGTAAALRGTFGDYGFGPDASTRLPSAQQE